MTRRKKVAPALKNKDREERYSLPKCWTGKSMTVKVVDQQTKEVRLKGVFVTANMINPKCHCLLERDAFFCEEGHILECHAGQTCEQAQCENWRSNHEKT